jgi:DNA-binding transcriptional MerR regulator
MDPRRDGVLTSRQLAAAAGVSADTIRHYEKLGLLATPLRTQGNYRLYPSAALLRVQTIRSALKAGFSLAELAGIFRERDAGGTPCRRVAGMASDKITALDRQIAELTDLRSWLADTVANWNTRLERTPPGKRAGLLESLATQQPSTQHHPKGSFHENHRPHPSPHLNSESQPRRRRSIHNDPRPAAKRA